MTEKKPIVFAISRYRSLLQNHET